MRLADMAERSFARHETFHPRYGWFRKAYAFVADEGNDFNQEDAPRLSGVGKNMVALGYPRTGVSVSGHKICGPGGVGALVGTRHALQRLAPVIHGGGHERGLRSGSLNVGGIVGLGAAARIAADERESESARVGDPARSLGDRARSKAPRRASERGPVEAAAQHGQHPLRGC